MLYHRLRQLDQRGTPIQIGLIAAGTFGTQTASQLAHAPGMCLAAIAELDLTKARRAYGLLEKATLAHSGNLLPIGLSQRAVLARDIPEDALIELPDSELLALRRQQEADPCA